MHSGPESNVNLTVHGELHNLGSGILNMVRDGTGTGNSNSLFDGILRNDGILNLTARLYAYGQSKVLNQSGGKITLQGNAAIYVDGNSQFINDGAITASGYEAIAGNTRPAVILSLAGGSPDRPNGRGGSIPVINNGLLTASSGYGVLSAAHGSANRQFVNRGTIRFTTSGGMTRALNITQHGDNNDLINDRDGVINVSGNNAIAMNSHGGYSRLINRGTINLGEEGTADTGMVAMQLSRWGESGSHPEGVMPKAQSAVILNDFSGRIHIYAKDSYAFSIEDGQEHKIGYLINRGDVQVKCGDRTRCGVFKDPYTQAQDLSNQVQDHQFSYAMPGVPPLPSPQQQVQERLSIGKQRVHVNTGAMRNVVLAAEGSLHNAHGATLTLEGDESHWFHAGLHNSGVLNVAARLSGSNDAELNNGKGGQIHLYGNGVMLLSPGGTFRNDGTIVAHEPGEANGERRLLTLRTGPQHGDKVGEVINAGRLIARGGYGVLGAQSVATGSRRTIVNRGRIDFTAENGVTRALHVEPFGNNNDLINDAGGEITVRGNNAVAMSSHAEYSRLINRGVINLGDPGTTDTGMVAMELGRWGVDRPSGANRAPLVQPPRTAILVNDHSGVINIHAKNSSAFRIENDSRDIGYLLNHGKVLSLCGDRSCRKFQDEHSQSLERTLSQEGRDFSYALPLTVAEGRSHTNAGTRLNAMLNLEGLLLNDAAAILKLTGTESSHIRGRLHNRGLLDVSATRLQADGHGELVNFEGGDIQFSSAGRMLLAFNSKFLNYGKITADNFTTGHGERSMLMLATGSQQKEGERIHRNLGTLVARGGYTVLGVAQGQKNARRSFINHGTIDFTAEKGVTRAMRIEPFGEYNDIVNDTGGVITVRGNGAVAMSTHGRGSRLVNRGTINLGEKGSRDTGMVAMEIGAWGRSSRPGQPDAATQTSILLNDDSGVINIYAKDSSAFRITHDGKTSAHLLNRGRVQLLCGDRKRCKVFADSHTESLNRTHWLTQGIEYVYEPPPLHARPDPILPPTSLIVLNGDSHRHTGTTRNVLLSAEGNVENAMGATLGLSGKEPSYFHQQFNNYGALELTSSLIGINTAELTNYPGATTHLSGNGQFVLSFRSAFTNHGTVIAEKPDKDSIEPTMLALDPGVFRDVPESQIVNYGQLIARDGYRVMGASGSFVRRRFINHGTIDFTAGQKGRRALQTGPFGDNNDIINEEGGTIIVRGNGAIAMSSQAHSTRLINRGTIELGEKGTTDGGMIAMELEGWGTPGKNAASPPLRTAIILNDTTGRINIHAKNSHAFRVAKDSRDIGYLINRGHVALLCGDSSCGTFRDDHTESLNRSGKVEDTLFGRAGASPATRAMTSLRGYVALTGPNGSIGTMGGGDLDVSGARVDTGFTLSTDATRVDFRKMIRGGHVEGVEGIRSTTDAWRAIGWLDEDGDVGVTMVKNDYRDLVSDASLQRVAGALERGYDAGALFRSLELTHRDDIVRAMRQLSGARIQQTLRPVQVLERRFARLADEAVDMGSGFGFNLLSRGQRGTQLGASSYDMVAVQQRFDIGDRARLAVRYGFARVKPDGLGDAGLDGSSQLLSVRHEQSLPGVGQGLQLEGEFRYALHQVSTRRTVRYGQNELPRTDEQPRVKVDARPRAEQRRDRFSSQLLLARPGLLLADRWTLTPLAGLKLRHHRDAALSERDGGIAALKINARRETALEGVFGLRLDHDGTRGAARGRGWQVGIEAQGGPTLYRRAGTRNARFAVAPDVRFALEEEKGGFGYDGRLNISRHGRGERFSLSGYLSRDAGVTDRGVMANWLRQF